MASPRFSIIIPVKNEEDNIAPLVDEIISVLGTNPQKLEIIFVDDGSEDDTLSRIKQKAKAVSVVRWISFDRNYGQTAAFDAGLKAARGELLVTMDGDLQNDPADIPMLEKNIDAADMVCGYRKKRHDNIIRRLSSKIANGVRNWITHENIIDVGCSLKMMRKECLENVKLLEGMHRFLPTLVKMEGYQVIQVPVNHRPRKFGKTKYGISNRLFKGLMDLFMVRWMQRRHLHYVNKEKK